MACAAMLGMLAPAALAQAARMAYVANNGGISVSAINTFSSTVSATLGVDSAPQRVAITPDGRRAYVTNTGPFGPPSLPNETVSVIDTENNSVIKSIEVGDLPLGVATSPDGSRVYVANASTSKISVIDTSTNTAVGELTAGVDVPTAVAVTPDGTRLYVVNLGSPPGLGLNANTFSVIDVDPASPTYNTVVRTFDVGISAAELALSPDGRRLYMVNDEENSMSSMDVANGTITKTIGVGRMPSGIAVTPNGRSVLIADSLSMGANVSVIDTAANEIVATLGAGIVPRGIAVVPDQSPIAEASVNPGNPGDATTFDAAASHDPDGSVARYDWDFGDGARPDDAGPTPSHTYTKAGTYDASITVTDNEGCSASTVFTGQTALCNGSPQARKELTVKIGEYQPQWSFSVTKRRRGRATNIGFDVSYGRLDLRSATLALPARFRVNLSRVPRCTVKDAATARRGGLRCRAPMRVGQIIFRYPESRSAIRRNIYLTGKRKFTVQAVTKGSGSESTAAKRTPRVASIGRRSKRSFEVSIAVAEQTGIRSVGIKLYGNKFGWLKGTRALRARRRVCGTATISNHTRRAVGVSKSRRCTRVKGRGR